MADLLKLLLKIRSREIDVAARLLARSDDLEVLAAGVRETCRCWKAGASSMFGKDALDLVEGKLAFAVVRRQAEDDPRSIERSRRRIRRSPAPEIAQGRDRDMTTYLPTLKQLQYLVALHEHGHFGRAADACFVSQSTLSAGLRDLETLLGVTLVERTKRAVRFTPLGNAVVAKAHRLLREAEELSDLVQAAGKPLSGELRMSVIPTIAPFLLPRMLPRLRRERPQLKLFLREETSAAAIESLHHGRADCVLLALPFATGEVEKRNDRARRAVTSPFRRTIRAIRPTRFRPTDRRKPAAAARRRPLPEGPRARRVQPPRTARLATMIGTSLHTLVQMVDNGLGLTMLPEMALDAGILNGTDVVARPLESDHRQPRDRAGLAQELAARGGVPVARRGTAGGLDIDAGRDQARQEVGIGAHPFGVATCDPRLDIRQVRLEPG